MHRTCGVAGVGAVGRCFNSFVCALPITVLPLPGASRLEAAVNLEWRPARQTVEVDEMVEIALYAVADSGLGQSLGAVTAILVWDPTYLGLWAIADPCGQGKCPENAYDWLSSGFPDDSKADGLNNTFADGNALYGCLAQLAAEDPAVATREGLWVTTFIFRALDPGVSELRLEMTFGENTRTLVASGDAPGQDITGTLGPPAEVTLTGCPRPAAVAVGSRYMAITPAPGAHQVALVVTGEIGDPAIACVSLFVQTDGTLDLSPIFRTPDEWETVHVTDLEIIPGARYHIQAACAQDQQIQSLSSPASATTWMWGDVNNNGTVDIDDVTLVLDGSKGILSGDTILENLDLAPCLPDRVIDALDVEDVMDANFGAPYPCTQPCSAGWGLEDFAEFALCMTGPAEQSGSGCGIFDADADNDVDLLDFAEFQRVFGSPLPR